MIIYDKTVSKVCAVLKLAPGVTLQDLAQECLDLFGEGANVDGVARVEDYFALNNTPIYGDYITIPCRNHMAVALQYVADNNLSTKAELIRIEWPMYEKDEITGEMTKLSYPDITYEVDVYDDMDVKIGTRQQKIGTIR